MPKKSPNKWSDTYGKAQVISSEKAHGKKSDLINENPSGIYEKIQILMKNTHQELRESSRIFYEKF